MSIDLAAASHPVSTSGERIRIMVVDDSAIIRGIISRWIEAETDMVVAASCRTGLDAVNQIERINPDAVILDIEMPDMDGITALPLLLAKKRDLVVIMASTLTLRNAEISLKALSLGAADYIPKPESNHLGGADTFRHELVQKIRHLTARLVRRRVPSPPLAPSAAPSALAAHAAAPFAPAKFSLRPFHKTRPQALLIGSSTGGPQALTALAAGLAPVVDRVPVLITQHMPPAFTTILAQHIGRASSRPAQEGVEGQIVKPGNIYIAPGGLHMRVGRQGGNVAIALDDGPQINFCRPAVDPLFMSAIDVWRGDLLAVILTGMGSDGMRGGKDIVAAGGNVIAQDEATSVVWGMPGAAAQAGICSAVLPLNQIGQKIQKILSGDFS
ncbi:chemotaxis response regulator protein-glutamate methylesterase [[Pseudomonas] carboxydohydrogena]|uniref:Protein-glutamate methylesterase/protein-glutamine glutaminase n=1 Tax=Afipia carboxydohydrogena TaxID=290 RepID=A0ABY8BM03_AFICR|nr:chemotaxis response regulator protein-glutamate methylesterase [[Pseudomonas] carboxydohydrogena]WEF51020.1 chemotaxis response regulator protein-glutamate methylesterase [[Pseudomonas] carboxydohydrogena]